ncbi:MAG: hypothetical protein IPK70_11210 [Flavobacteriales bacterium]|jgi:signal transduction histidine kinase|nr:hypothetical protein [Flavobacteriales bacterium]
MNPLRCAILPALLHLIPAASAEQAPSRSMRALPPFADAVIDRQMQRILHQMDAFHGDSAIMLINGALAQVKAAEHPEVAHYLLAYRAEVLYYEGLFNEAMRDLNEAERLAHQLQDSTLISNAYNLKGLLHENIQDSQEALPYLRLALRWFPQAPAARYPVSELHHIHGNLGSYLNTLGHRDSARYHARLSLRLAEEAGAARATAVAWWALGNIALKADEPDSALAFHDRAWSIADSARDHDIGVDALVGRCMALAEAGRAKEARAALDLARSYLDAHRHQIGLVTQRNFERQAARAFERIGELAQALGHLDEWHRIDSTIAANNIRSALSTQAELLRADNDLEVERIERERVAALLVGETRNRQLAIIVSALALLAITSVYLILNARLRHRRRMAELRAEREHQERTIAELRVREQVSRDLHDDLGVGLSALKLRSEMALQQGRADGMAPLLREQASSAEELIASMRHIIWALQDDQGSLDDLVAYIAAHARAYLDAHGIAIEVHARTMPDRMLTTQERRNLFLIVKEALHNVVKHAEASRVQLHLEWRDGLTIDVADDGRGMQPQREHGHGLINMRKRAEMIGASIGFSAGLDGRGTSLRMQAPLAERKLA